MIENIQLTNQTFEDRIENFLKLGKTVILLTFLVGVFSSAVNTMEVDASELTEETTVQGEEVVTLQEEAVSVEETVAQDEIPIESPDLAEVASEEAEETEAEKKSLFPKWTGSVLTKRSGVNFGPSGKETYYNLSMSGVVKIMRNLGYDEASFPYWVREDGVKMLGDYVICAANLSIRPRGTLVSTSLGDGIVCDTGTFAYYNKTQLDLATAW